MRGRRGFCLPPPAVFLVHPQNMTNKFPGWFQLGKWHKDDRSPSSPQATLLNCIQSLQCSVAARKARGACVPQKTSSACSPHRRDSQPLPGHQHQQWHRHPEDVGTLPCSSHPFPCGLPHHHWRAFRVLSQHCSCDNSPASSIWCCDPGVLK